MQFAPPGRVRPRHKTYPGQRHRPFQSNRASLRIPAADARFHYEGRIDFSDTNAPVLIWQASRISIDFEGNAVRLLFDDAKGQNYFNARVDGSNTIVEANEGMPVSPATLSGFGPGRHHLELFKRSEANAGTVHFRGIEIVPPAKVWAPTLAPLPTRDGIHRGLHYGGRVQ